MNAGIDSTALVYVGPSLQFLTHGTVFRNGLPARVAEMRRTCPTIQLLFVSPRALTASLREVRTVGSPLHAAACTVRQALK